MSAGSHACRLTPSLKVDGNMQVFRGAGSVMEKLLAQFEGRHIWQNNASGVFRREQEETRAGLSREESHSADCQSMFKREDPATLSDAMEGALSHWRSGVGGVVLDHASALS